MKRIQPARLAAIVESSQDAIISKTLDGRILTWNEAALAMFGYRVEEVIGRPMTLLQPPDHMEEEQILSGLRRGERFEHYDTVRMAKGGGAPHGAADGFATANIGMGW